MMLFGIDTRSYKSIEQQLWEKGWEGGFIVRWTCEILALLWIVVRALYFRAIFYGGIGAVFGGLYALSHPPVTWFSLGAFAAFAAFGAACVFCGMIGLEVLGRVLGALGFEGAPPSRRAYFGRHRRF